MLSSMTVISYKSFYLSSDDPNEDYVRIYNEGPAESTFSINLNGSLYLNEQEILDAILMSPSEYDDEPIQRKVWRFIVKNKNHWWPITDSQWAKTPALFFNSLGFGNCGDASFLFSHVMRALGYQTRIWTFDGHTVPEVFIDGRWELWDPDWSGIYYYNRDGQIAGAEELTADTALITNPINPIVNIGSNPSAGLVYSQQMAEIYSKPLFYDSVLLNPNIDYELKFNLPPKGLIEFPRKIISQLESKLESNDRTFFPDYKNLKLTIPRSWTGTLNLPLVLHSIGYDGEHSLSVIGKDADGNWQSSPTVANWVTDTMVPSYVCL